MSTLTRCHTRCTLALAAGILAVNAFMVPAASATDGLSCTGLWEISLSPGIGTTVTRSTFVVVGSPTTLRCAGVLDGTPISAPIAFTETGTSTGTCTAGEGEGEFVATIPTAHGEKTVRGPFTFGWAGTAGWITSPRWNGAFTFAPTAGDCLTKPAERAVIVANGLLTT